MKQTYTVWRASFKGHDIMKAFGLSAAASVLLLGLASTPSSATAIQPTTFTFGEGTHSTTFAGTTTNSFTDLYTLILLVNGDTSIGFNSSFTGKQASTKYTSFTLTNGTTTYASDDITYKTVTSGKTTRTTGATGDIFVSDLTAGTYTLSISGTSNVATNYSGTVSVSSVPLPPALPMFGAALLGLGALGYSVKRKGDQSLAVSAV